MKNIIFILCFLSISQLVHAGPFLNFSPFTQQLISKTNSTDWLSSFGAYSAATVDNKIAGVVAFSTTNTQSKVASLSNSTWGVMSRFADGTMLRLNATNGTTYGLTFVIGDDGGPQLCIVTNPATFNIFTNATYQQLIAWTSGKAYQIITSTGDIFGNVTSGSVLWPDGSGGTYTSTATNSIIGQTDSYTITHTASGKTITQPLVSRDSSTLSITNKPALTIAP